jgi:hypothetical protein
VIQAAIVVVGGTWAGSQGAGAGGHIELWQVINLVGAPILAVLFGRPVIDDLRAWLNSRSEPGADGS